MKAELINPFITSTVNVFKTMLNIEPKKGDIFVKKDNYATFDISGVIGMAGKVSGSVVLSFPEDLALDVVSQFLGEKRTEMNGEVADAIGELVNMIAGSTKVVFAERGMKYNISIPNVITGKGHTINRPSSVLCIAVKFYIGDRFFVIEVALKEHA